MARKRSLKDAAADRLVEKNKIVPAAVVAPAKKPAAGHSVVKATQVEPATESFGRQVPLAETSNAPEGKKMSHPHLIWIAISLLIGSISGYFFGVGQAMGPANVSYLFIGSVGGYFFGRFIKII
jgi:hypothetical protein